MQYNPSRRLLDERHWSGLRIEDIAGSTYGGDGLRAAGLLDASADTADVDVDQVGAGIEVIAPDFLEQHAAGDHLAGIADQELEQRELRRQQADLLPATPGRTAHPRRTAWSGNRRHLLAGHARARPRPTAR